MKPKIVNVGLFILLLIAGLPALAAKPDPLYGNYVLGNSAEIITSWPNPEVSIIASSQILDFRSGSLDSVFYKVGGVFNAGQVSKVADVTSGDFDGDGKDDIVYAYLYNGEVRIHIPYLNRNPYSEYGSYDFPVGSAYTGPRSDENPLRLISGNFDSDAAQEFLIAWWDYGSKKIRFGIYKASPLGNPNPIAWITDDYLAPGMGDGARFDITAGDFNGDGVDEIILAAMDSVATDSWRLYASIFSYNEDGGNITRHSKQYIYDYNPPSNYLGEGDFIERIAMTTGDFDGNLRDEAVIGYQHRNGYWWLQSWPTCWFGCWYYTTWTTYYLQPIRISNDLESVTFDLGNRISNYNIIDWLHVDEGDKAAEWKPGVSMSLTSGDLNVDGRDEVVWSTYWGVLIESFPSRDTLRMEEKANLGRGNCHGDASLHTARIADVNLDPLDKTWYPEIITVDWSGSGGKQNIKVYGPNIDSLKNITGATLLSARNINEAFAGQLALTVGDLDGDGVRLGPPRYTKVSNFGQPLIILNAPPVHYDILDEIFDVNGCFNGQICNFETRYAKVSSQIDELVSEVKWDWGLGASISCSTGFLGYSVEAKLSADFGMNFSKEHSQMNRITVSQGLGSNLYDKVYASFIDYDLWEYPVHYIDSLGQPATDYAMVVGPSAVSNRWISIDDDTYSNRLYIPSHEPGNLLSYCTYPSALDNPYVANPIKIGDGFPIEGGSSPTTWAMTFDDVSGDLNKKEWNFGVDFEASVGWSMYEVSVNGHYNYGEIATRKTSIQNLCSLSVALGNIDIGTALYTVKPYTYWAKSGALVIDYQVDLPSSGLAASATWWDTRYGSSPDASFIMPWKYHAEKGLGNDYLPKRFKTYDIIIRPLEPDPGDTVTITARVHNFSLTYLPGDMEVAFYINHPDSGGTPMVGINGTNSAEILSGLSPHDYAEASHRWVVPGNIPIWSKVYAEIDPDETISEIHEDNNIGWISLHVPEGGHTDVNESQQDVLPAAYVLHDNYPNPFNATTIIRYSVPRRGHVELCVYNILGQKVRTLVDQETASGHYTVEWNGNDSHGNAVASGIYLYRLRSGDYADTKKMVLLK